MQYLLTLKLNQEPLVIEQLLQTIRYRGYFVTTMNVCQTELGYDVSLSLESESTIDNLIKQIDKLYDVAYLTCNLISSLEKSA